jgi:hypothetical protein
MSALSGAVIRLIQIEAEQFHPIILRFSESQPVIHVAGNLLWALGCKFIEPINELGITTTLLNETIQPITAIPPAFLTTHEQHIELGAIRLRMSRSASRSNATIAPDQNSKWASIFPLPTRSSALSMLKNGELHVRQRADRYNEIG